MGTSWYEKVKKFKSPVRVAAAILLRSRETLNSKVCELNQRIGELQSQLAQQRQQLEKQQQRMEALQQRAVEAERQRDQARQSVNLPEDPPLGTHGYGARMISLAINVARSIGLRGAVRALRVFFQWLGVEQAIPGRTSIRNWLQRLGIDELKQPVDSQESLVIMVDHSSQIGPEKVMLALGVNAARLPEPERPSRMNTFACWQSSRAIPGKRPIWNGNTKHLPIVTERLGRCWWMVPRNCVRVQNAWKSGVRI